MDDAGDEGAVQVNRAGLLQPFRLKDNSSGTMQVSGVSMSRLPFRVVRFEAEQIAAPCLASPAHRRS